MGERRCGKTVLRISKTKEQSTGCRYVQERLSEERHEIVKVFNQGARLYVCGSAMVGEGVAATAKKIYLEAAEELGEDLTDEAVDEWFQRIRNDSVCIRYFCLRGQICN